MTDCNQSYHEQFCNISMEIEGLARVVLDTQKELRSRKAAIPQLLEDLFAQTTPENLQSVASEIYWMDKGFADPVRKVFSRFRPNSKKGKFRPNPNIQTFYCCQCSTEVEGVKIESWTEYEKIECRKVQVLCRECYDKYEKEKAENTRQWQEYHKEQEEASARNLEALRKMPYSEYLQTEHWKTVRGRALNKAYWRCQLCNASKPLDVHHRTYERLGCEFPGDVIALCRECHNRHHQSPKKAAAYHEPANE